MSAESERLREIQDALEHADLDTEVLVDEAWQAARAEVRTVLRRAFRHELLERVTDIVGTRSPAQQPAPPAPPHPEPASSPAPEPDHSPEPDASPAPEPDPSRPDVGQPATYVFGITRASVALDDDLPTIGSGPVRGIDRDDLRAVVCDADADALRSLAELGPDDLERLADAANTHEEVLGRVAAQACVLPLRLGTMLQDDQVASDLLSAHGDALRAELDRLEGHAEWAVVVRLLEGAPDDELLTTDVETGGAYLRQRQNALAQREERWEARDRLTTELHEALSELAVASETVESRPLERAAPALHGVYLLTWEGIERFESAVEDARATHPEATIEATGPLPPYHFTCVDLSLDSEAA